MVEPALKFQSFPTGLDIVVKYCTLSALFQISMFAISAVLVDVTVRPVTVSTPVLATKLNWSMYCTVPGSTVLLPGSVPSPIVVDSAVGVPVSPFCPPVTVSFQFPQLSLVNTA